MQTDNKQRKSVKCYSFIGVLLIVIVVAAVLVGLGVVTLPISCESESDGVAMVSARNVDGSEKSDVVISSDSDTNFYLFLPWENKSLYVSGGSVGADAYKKILKLLGANTFSRKEVPVTLTLRFNDVKYYRTEEDKEKGENGLSLLMYVNSYFEIPSYFWKGRKFVCKGSNYAGIYAENAKDIKVNIRESYYDYLTSYKELFGDFGNYTVGVYVDGYGFALSEENTTADNPVSSKGCYLKSAPREPGDIDLGDNGGVDVSGGSGSFWAWFSSFPKWAQYGVYILVGLVALAFLATLLRIIFGKK